MILNPENCYIPRRRRLLGQTTKQPLSNFVRENPYISISDFKS